MPVKRKPKIDKKQAIRELWRRGVLDYPLHEKQLEIKKSLLDSKDKINVVLCSRRFGKTFVLLNMAIELCIKKSGSIVKYVSPQQRQGIQNIKENMEIILKDCPPTIKPEWKVNDKKYIFPNGSEIQVAGTDNGSHESLRGGRADMCIVDEAGFCDHLDYVIKSILRPTTLTTKGNIYLVSTPSKLHAHEFIQKYVKPYSAAGKIKKYTIHDNPMLTQEDIDELLLDYPDGKNDPAFRREYLCELLQDKDSVVFPEFTEQKKFEIIKEVKRPPYYDAYVSGDVGFKDLTAYLFGYWDFAKARLVIEDELIMNGPEMTTENLANHIKAKEETLFVNKFNEPQKPYMRVMDNNLIMVNDLARLHGLNFIPTAKDDKEAQVNQVRMMIANNQIIIHPKCKNLIYHLENAVWDKHHKKFERIPGSASLGLKDSHSDGSDALIYLVRNLVRSKNPYPPGYDIPNDDSHYVKVRQREPEISGTLKKIFNIKIK